jgi:hypothetical protein
MPRVTGNTFVCPCGRPHTTLLALLTCHPRALRAITDKLDTAKPAAIQDTNIQRFRHVVTGSMGRSELAYLMAPTKEA